MAVCALCPNVLAAKGPVSQCLPLKEHFSVSGEDATAVSVPFVTCLLPEVARLGRSVFSSGGEAAESADVLFWQGWKSRGFRQVLRQGTMVTSGCHEEGKSDFHPQVVSHCWGATGSLLFDVKSYWDLL